MVVRVTTYDMLLGLGGQPPRLVTVLLSTAKVRDTKLTLP